MDNSVTVPSAKEVEVTHTNADTDGSNNSIHHSLGFKRGQASPGDHTHDGGTSKLLLEGVTLTGVKAGNTALASVIAALAALGATDNTT
jgi:hypothetical protein